MGFLFLSLTWWLSFWYICDSDRREMIVMNSTRDEQQHNKLTWTKWKSSFERSDSFSCFYRYSKYNNSFHRFTLDIHIHHVSRIEMRWYLCLYFLWVQRDGNTYGYWSTASKHNFPTKRIRIERTIEWKNKKREKE